jgi:hypothetical protein
MHPWRQLGYNAGTERNATMGLIGLSDIKLPDEVREFAPTASHFPPSPRDKSPAQIPTRLRPGSSFSLRSHHHRRHPNHSKLVDQSPVKSAVVKSSFPLAQSSSRTSANESLKCPHRLERLNTQVCVPIVALRASPARRPVRNSVSLCRATAPEAAPPALSRLTLGTAERHPRQITRTALVRVQSVALPSHVRRTNE